MDGIAKINLLVSGSTLGREGRFSVWGRDWAKTPPDFNDQADLFLQPEEEKEAVGQLTDLIAKLNAAFDPFRVELRYEIHKPTQAIVVKLVNVETGEIIREIPPTKFLDMIAEMLKMVGLLVDEIA